MMSKLTMCALLINVAISAFAGPEASDNHPAVIVNSGSTNTRAFRIVVERSGTAEYSKAPRRILMRAEQQAPKPVQIDLPLALVQRFYSDLEAAQPLSALPHRACFKSVSFGSTLTIEFNGGETPDLSCPVEQDARSQNLARDVRDILKHLPKTQPQL